MLLLPEFPQSEHQEEAANNSLQAPPFDNSMGLGWIQRPSKAPQLFEAGSGRSFGHGGERCGGPALP